MEAGILINQSWFNRVTNEPISFHWSLSMLPKNIRKPLVFGCFQGGGGGLERDQWHEMS